MPILVTSAFDSGNIEVRDVGEDGRMRLALRPDAGGEFAQWFHFRLSGVRGVPLDIAIVDLGKSAYPLGWPGYRARVSTDLERWVQADTSYDPARDGGTLRICVTPEADSIWCAYFAPYSEARHQALIATHARHPAFRADVLGLSLDGRPIDRLRFGSGPRQIWIYARQHPGETMAEWFMEGMIAELADPASPSGRTLGRATTLHLIPNMNPDGSVRGHLRTNAAGANLNREWHDPRPDRAPEVLAVRQAMDATGVDIGLDVHGDEALPHVFIAGFEGVPGVTQAQLDRLQRFLILLDGFSPDFQTRVGYPLTSPGKANLSMSTNQLAHRFGCLSMTLEMPFKDAIDHPEPVEGWSPARSRHLARACLQALAALVTEEDASQ